ncbi:flagellar hook-associated protein FlgK, partial [Pseudomonadales bacterium]|nr:flagellar hook-associated protein FlgK [Pseudomonadales bacterium]
MPDLLSIGTSATQLYRQALSTVSNNIANMTTEGYSRQEIVSVENSPSQQGVYYLGTGATVETVTRAFDAFAEDNVRNGASELGFQQPTIQYANRIVDVMGSETGGLSGAMDKFFASANELTTNPSSSVLRTSFLATADFLASRMTSISEQLEAIGLEAAADTDAGVNKINGISEQLALINGKLQQKLTEARQPPGLLDTRDQLLRELSSLVKVEVKIATSGQADVLLAGGGNASSLVKGQNASVLRVVHGENVVDRSIITLEMKGPQSTGQQYQLPGLQGGTVGGLLDFKNSVLKNAVEDLDNFAKTFVTEVNDLHHAGVDLNGNLGGDIFRIDPVVGVEALTSGSLGNMTVSVVTGQTASNEKIMVTWDKDNNGFIVSKNAENSFFAVDGSGEVQFHGLRIQNSNDLQDGAVLALTVTDRPAKFMTMVIENENEVAAASRLTATSSINNSSAALAQVE